MLSKLFVKTKTQISIALNSNALQIISKDLNFKRANLGAKFCPKVLSLLEKTASELDNLQNKPIYSRHKPKIVLHFSHLYRIEFQIREPNPIYDFVSTFAPLATWWRVFRPVWPSSC